MLLVKRRNVWLKPSEGRVNQPGPGVSLPYSPEPISCSRTRETQTHTHVRFLTRQAELDETHEGQKVEEKRNNILSDSENSWRASVFRENSRLKEKNTMRFKHDQNVLDSPCPPPMPSGRCSFIYLPQHSMSSVGNKLYL